MKPQFELSKDKIGKKGIVTDLNFRNQAVREVGNWLESKNWAVLESIECSITGIKGNQEYFIYAIRK